MTAAVDLRVMPSWKVGTPQGWMLARARLGRPDGRATERDRRWTSTVSMVGVTGKAETVR